MGPAGMDVPRVLGHENGGHVDAVGDLVSTVKVGGHPVLLYPPHSCGVCVNCRRGRDMHCANHEFTGLSLDGGFTEYLVVGEREIVPLPEGIDPVDVAPHSDAGITAYHALKRVAPLMLPGTTAVVLGAGGSATSACNSRASSAPSASWPSIHIPIDASSRSSSAPTRPSTATARWTPCGI